MSKKWIILAAAVVAAFASVSALKRSDREVAREPSGVEASAVDSARAFWDLYRRATSLRTTGRTQDAAKTYARLLDMHPDHEDALYYLGNMNADLGRYAEARDQWRRLVTVNPASARGHLRLGDAAFCFPDSDLFDVEAASDAYRAALELNREETGPLLRMGLLHLVDGNMEASDRYLQSVTGSNFRSVSGYFFRGYLAWSNGEVSKAESLFAIALEYAQGADTTSVIGEGDSKPGGSTGAAVDIECPALDRFTSDLAAVQPGDAAVEMQRRYDQVQRGAGARRGDP